MSYFDCSAAAACRVSSSTTSWLEVAPPSKDVLATTAVAAAAAVYGLWATGLALTAASTRLLGAVVFALGWVACTSTTRQMAKIYGPDKDQRPPLAYVVPVSVLGAVAFMAGVMTLVTASEAMLAVVVVAMLALWAMATIRHATTIQLTGDQGERTHAHT